MSYVSGIYRLAVVRKTGKDPLQRRSGSHHNQTNKKLPDDAVLSLRREYEAAPRGKKFAVVRKYAGLYGASFYGTLGIAKYISRSNPDRPLDPSLA